jgi:hypothetical protein
MEYNLASQMRLNKHGFHLRHAVGGLIIQLAFRFYRHPSKKPPNKVSIGVKMIMHEWN